MARDDFLRRSDVELRYTFPAPARAVFHAWTNPTLVARWMWAGLGDESWAECDLRVGGAYRVCTKLDGGQHHGPGFSGMCGIFVAIESNARLVYTVHWDADVIYNRPGNLVLDEVADVRFESVDDGTSVVYRHLGLPGDEQCAPAHEAGIKASFDLLARLLVDDAAFRTSPA